MSSYSGIEILLNPSESDDKRYTFILKDQILPRNPDNGREQSTVSWEYDFQLPVESTRDGEKRYMKLYIPWNDFKATYRGKEDKEAKSPDLSSIKRLSIMTRRFDLSPNQVIVVDYEAVSSGLKKGTSS